MHERPEHAWSAGIGGTGRKTGAEWDGHLFTHVTLPGVDRSCRCYLIDAAASQLSRPGPGRGLDVDNHATAVTADFLSGKRHFVTQTYGSALIYQRMDGKPTYTQTRDWHAARPLKLKSHLADRLRAL